MIGLLAAAALAASLPGFHEVSTGPGGGVVLAGRVPDGAAAWDRRDSAVYLPPGYSPSSRYPVAYLLHGLPGGPSEYYGWLRFAEVADGLVGRHEVRPFIAVFPVAGRPHDERRDEWAAEWESYVVRDVVPWTDAHLPTIADAANRAIGGLCAGGYGALDIGLRHLDLFGTLESSGGYFVPFHDGPFAHATRAFVDAHSPALLVRKRAAELRRRHVRIWISTGGDHGIVRARWTRDFSSELGRLGLVHGLWLYPPADAGRFWRAQLPASMRFAFPAG